ncbi:MAG TPA: HAD-IB family hydrolase [Parafilimonas sp.]|nr:HAD-IB family hydrolase [Parafilimonas sp.]
MENGSDLSIAFFDFDGTITSKDTLAEIIKFAKGKLNYYSGLLALSPILFSYKTGLLSNHRAKEIMLQFFFKNTPVNEFQNICNQFTRTILPGLIREQALNEINQHKKNNTKVVVVSASPINWVQPWCSEFNIDCIATCLEVKNNKITGKISGRNCSGNEKVKHILNNYKLTEYSKIYAYGDTRGDLPMLSLSTEKYYKPFK